MNTKLDLSRRLMSAVCYGQDQAVRKLIRAGASVTAKDCKQQTALHKAVSSSWCLHSNVVNTLIDAGADVNGQDEDGTTPLMEAANRGHDQVVLKLIRAGASVTTKDSKQQAALHKAIRSCSFYVVKALIEAGADVNGHDKHGTTPLMEATNRGHDQVVYELIRAGASVTAKDKRRQTALLLAISSRSWQAHRKDLYSVVKALIEAGADVNEQDEDGATPLMEATYRRHDQMVHELIRAGASVAAMNMQQKKRALHKASLWGDSSVVKTLIDAGADVSGQDEDGRTPLIEAANRGHDQVVLELIRAGANVTAKDSKQQTALHKAISSCHFYVVKALIEAGADVNEQDEGGATPLMEATYRRHDQMVHELIRAGASVAAMNMQQKKRALHKASLWGDSSVVKTLIDAGADVSGQDEDGRTPLIEAANRGHDQVVLELIRAGANVTAKDSKQQTALHKAIGSCHFCVVEALIEARADVNGHDKHGTTPLMVAADRRHDQVVHELIRAGASVAAMNTQQKQRALRKGSMWGHSSIVKTLIKAGADVNEQDEDGRTPLMEATDRCHVQVVHELIRAGASVTAKDSKQQTAFHKAMWNGHSTIVKALIEAGADVNGQDEDRTTPLMVAADRRHDQLVRELIRAGANVTAKNIRQRTALHIAMQNGHSTIVKTLIGAEADVSGQVEDGVTMEAADKGGREGQTMHEPVRADSSVAAKENKSQTALHIHSSNWGDPVSVVKTLIEAGADVNGEDEDGITPLMQATSRGYDEVVQELIRAGASVTVLNMQQKDSALHYACWKDHPSDVNTPIEAGADVNGQDEDGATPLVDAVKRGRDYVVHELIRAGASVTAMNKQLKQRALCYASWEGHCSVMKTLIEAGADVNGQDAGGKIPLLEAATKGHDQAVHELIRAGANVIAMNKQLKQRALCYASREGNCSVMKTLVVAGADVNEQDEGGTTPLMVAAYRRHNQVVGELIRAGASVTAKDRKQQTALHKAISCGHSSVVRALIEARANVSGEVEDETTPLMEAAHKGHDQVVHELNPSVTAMENISQTALPIATSSWWDHNIIVKAPIGAEANVSGQVEDGVTMEAADKGGREGQVIHEPVRADSSVAAKENKSQTALHIDSSNWGGPVSVVKTLIEAGADVNGEDEDGITPLMQAASRGYDEVVQELIRAGASVTVLNMQQKDSALHYACWKDHPSDVNTPIEAGADVNGQDEDGATPLVDAVKRGRDYVVHELIRAGASVTAMNMKQKRSAFCYACRECHADVVKMLVEAWADTELVENGKTLLMDAAYEGHEQVVHMLIRAGVSVAAISTCTVAAGSTALHFAADTNRIACGVLLVEAGADITARNEDSKSPLDLASGDFQQAIQRTQSFSSKRIVAVIGNAEHGKSTLITALKSEGKGLLKRFTNRFAKVQDISQRTIGIDAVEFSSQKYGESLFYDFAGQSDFHGPHQSFLEAMLSKPGVSVTLLLLVKATDEADIITQQVTHWLQPLALMSAPSTPQVILVGSFLDQVKSKEKATKKLLQCTHSVQEDLPFNIHGPCLLDCRYPESEGINQICTFFIETQPLLLNCSTFSYNLHWVLVQVRKALSVQAITLYAFWEWLLENDQLLPLHLSSPEEVCRDLTAVGHALFLPNKRDPSKSWLILDLQAILHNVYGTLLSRSQGKANKFGLLHCCQLAELFPKLDQAMIQEVLVSLELCIQVDPLLMREELFKLTVEDKVEGWLYFPALVSAQPLKVFPDDPDPQHLQWACWQLRTFKKHFISAHLLQTIILRLAANHVFTHELSPSVREHCCSVWVNGLSWRSTKGVDIAVQISDNSVVQVVGRSKAGPEKLHRYMSTIVQTVVETIIWQSPKLKATSYLVHPYTSAMWEDPSTPPPDSLYPVASIIVCCISDGDDHVLSLLRQDGHPHQIRILELFGGWFPSLSVVEDMAFKEEPQRGLAFSSDQERRSVLCHTVHSVGRRLCAMLFRRFVSRNAAGKGRAVLEGVGLSTEAIKMCYSNSPRDEEEAVQSGLNRWRDGEGVTPPIWKVLFAAMDYAGIAVQHITSLEEELLKAPISSDLPSIPPSSSSQSRVNTSKKGLSSEMKSLTATQQVMLTQQILDHFRDQFIAEMIAETVIMELHHKDIIDEGDLKTISRNPNPRQQNEYLHLCLKKKCTKGAFRTVCDVISSVQGNPKMKALGAAMKRRLETGDTTSPTALCSESHMNTQHTVTDLPSVLSSSCSQIGATTADKGRKNCSNSTESRAQL